MDRSTRRALVAGGVAGGTEAICTMPFEVAKNRIQLGLGPRTISANMADTVRTAGPTGLFYGLQAQLVQTAAKSSIRFAAFERFKVYFDTFTAGILAGLTEAIVLVAPTERLKVLRQAELVHSGGGAAAAAAAATKAAASRSAATSAATSAAVNSATVVGAAAAGGGGPSAAAGTYSLVGAITKIVKEHGVAGLWHGTGPTAARQAAANGIRLGLFELLATPLRERTPLPKAVVPALAGGLCGIVSTIMTNPIDVIKTHVQASSQPPASVLRNLLREEGLAVLAKGTSARCIKIGSGQAVIFGVYDLVKRNL